MRGIRHRHTLLQDAHNQPPQDIDQSDYDTSYRVPSYKLTRAVHRPVKICLFLNITSPFPCFRIVDQTRIEIGVDTHLLARHGIKGKSCGHFRHPRCAFGDDDKINQHQHQKDDKADHEVAAHHKTSEGPYDISGRCGTFIPVEEYQTCGGHI